MPRMASRRSDGCSPKESISRRTDRVRLATGQRADSAAADTVTNHQELGMPELAVDPSKFAGMSEEQAKTFPRRKLIGEDLTPEQVAAMPKMISTDSHVMEPDELWHELPPRLRELLPKVPFRNNPPG